MLDLRQGKVDDARRKLQMLSFGIDSPHPACAPEWRPCWPGSAPHDHEMTIRQQQAGHTTSGPGHTPNQQMTSKPTTGGSAR